MAEFTPEMLVLTALPHGLVAGDRQGQITLINPAAAQLLGLDVDRWLGQPVAAFCEHYEIPPLAALAAQPQAIAANGQRLSAQLLALPAVSARSGLGFAILLSPQEAQLQMMTDLFGALSYAIRTPLTVVQGYAQMLLSDLVGPLAADQRELVEAIHQHGRNLTGQLYNATQMVQLDMGLSETWRTPVDLRHAIGHVITRLRNEIAAKGLSLTVSLPDDLPPALADFGQLQIALYQLLDNARRFTEQGGITVRATACAGHVRVEVEDSGCGIAPAMHARIFQRFIRGDDLHARPGERGIGLGLAICKQLVERQGGSVEVTSTPGQGSRFSVTLPIARGPGEALEAEL